MQIKNIKTLIVAYYLAAFDKRGIEELGYKTWIAAFKDISSKFEVKVNTIRNMRDEFDPCFDNKRVGWYQRPIRSSRAIVKKHCDSLSFNEYANLVKHMINDNSIPEKFNNIIEEVIRLEEATDNIRRFDSGDADYLKDINELSRFPKMQSRFEYANIPKQKRDALIYNGIKLFPRSRQCAINAMMHAGYCCEVNTDHDTFIRKNSLVNYVEPHHLIPISNSDDFSVSLDIEENIVVLCSNCHNLLHYGKDYQPVLRKLYEMRKNELKKAGIDISFEKLLYYYK